MPFLIGLMTFWLIVSTSPLAGFSPGIGATGAPPCIRLCRSASSFMRNPSSAGFVGTAPPCMGVPVIGERCKPGVGGCTCALAASRSAKAATIGSMLDFLCGDVRFEQLHQSFPGWAVGDGRAQRSRHELQHADHFVVFVPDG